MTRSHVSPIQLCVAFTVADLKHKLYTVELLNWCNSERFIQESDVLVPRSDVLDIVVLVCACVAIESERVNNNRTNKGVIEGELLFVFGLRYRNTFSRDLNRISLRRLHLGFYTRYVHSKYILTELN